jgi:hypothetical protein
MHVKTFSPHLSYKHVRLMKLLNPVNLLVYPGITLTSQKFLEKVTGINILYLTDNIINVYHH